MLPKLTDTQSKKVLTKKEAAQQQLESAMLLFTLGCYASAITLGYAAEGCVPKQETDTMFRQLLQAAEITAVEGALETFYNKKSAANNLNLASRWMRHNDIIGYPSLDNLDIEAFILIYRGMSSFATNYGVDSFSNNMRSFIAAEGSRLYLKDGKLALHQSEFV